MYIRAGQLGQDESIEAIVNASKRALRERLADYERDCTGVRVLHRLQRAPRDRIEEFARLKRRLDEAVASGIQSDIARAKCELSQFWWEEWGSERTRRDYQSVMQAIRGVQSQLERERWWRQRWRCETWPRDVRQPEIVTRGCAEKARNIRRLEGELSTLEMRRQSLENRFLQSRQI